MCHLIGLELTTTNSRFGINTAVVTAPNKNFPVSTILHLIALYYWSCLAIQGQFFSEMECSLSSSASKTISSVFHLHNTSATRELSVYLDGQRLRHECHPTYLGVTLDRTLSYRVHLTKTAGKLKNQNNLLMKLASSTWGASANTLQSSVLALCYSAAEYFAPVWSCSAHTS